MKKSFINKLFISALALSTSINVVKAVSCEDIVSGIKKSSEWGQNSAGFSFGEDTEHYDANGNYLQERQLVYQVEINGKTYNAYCRNPSVSHGTGTNFKCSESTGGNLLTGASDSTNAYEAGMLEILKHGSAPNIDQTERNAVDFAMRVYEMYYSKYGDDTVGVGMTNKNYDYEINQSYRYYADLWADELGVSSTLTGYKGFDASEIHDPSDTMNYTGGNVNDVLDRAKSLLASAFNTSSGVKEGNVKIPTVDVSKTPKVERKPVDKSSSPVQYEVRMTYTVNIQNLSEGSTATAEFSCPECEKYGSSVQATLEVNGSEAGSGAVDLLQYAEGGSGTVELTVVFKATKPDYDCAPIPFELKVKYNAANLNNNAVSITEDNCPQNNCQHFYVVLDDEAGEQEINIAGNAEICSEDCEVIEEQCQKDGAGSEACKKFEEQFGGSCEKVECVSYMGGGACSESDSNFEFLEGYSGEPCQRPSKEDLNVKGCVAKTGSQDAAGNSYQFKDTNVPEGGDDDYCGIFCMEEYHFVLPGIKESNSGRYFTLSASIESGKKLCYTDQIKQDKFSKDYYALQKELVVDHNDLEAFKGIESRQAVAGYNTPKVHSCSIVVGDVYGNNRTLYQPVQATDYKYTWRVENVVSQDSVTYINPLQVVVESAKPGNSGDISIYAELEHGSISCTGSSMLTCTYESNAQIDYSTCTLVEDGYDLDTSKMATKNSEINNKMPNDVKKLQDMIEKINSCSMASETYPWEFRTDFEPEIKFDYDEESYINGLKQNNRNRLETSGGGSFSSPSSQYCVGMADNSYEKCSGGNWNNYPVLIQDYQKLICTGIGSSGCKVETKSVTVADYMKYEMTVSGATFTTPTLFTMHPSGAIVLDGEGASNTTPFTGWPVGLGTGAGTYQYALIVNNLGEYFDTGDLGRVWNVEEAGSTAMKAITDKCSNTGLASSAEVGGSTYETPYVCAYKVNCPDCPVTCDPNGCEGERKPTCPTCPVDCDGCIVDGEKPNISYRPVTPEDLHPNDTSERPNTVNWDWKDLNTVLELKAFVTTQEIQNDGDKIYDVEYHDQVTFNSNVNTDYAVRVNMDSKMINWVKDYNENNPNYADSSTLECYDYGNYQNIFCYSTFIDSIVNNRDLSDHISFSKDRLLTSAERNANTASSGYWTTWDQVQNSSIFSQIQDKVNLNITYGGSTGVGGPAWK